MTTKTTDELLEPVGAALVSAHHALEVSTSASGCQQESASGEVEQPLVARACAAVASWEQAQRKPEDRDESAIAERVRGGRGHVEDLRVQDALAQLEPLDSPHHANAALEQSASSVEKPLVGLVRDVGSATGAFRAALRPHD